MMLWSRGQINRRKRKVLLIKFMILCILSQGRRVRRRS